MAAVTNVQLFTWIGVAPAANRNAIIADFLSDGLQGIEHMSDEEVKDACASYAKRNDGAFPIMLTPVQKQRIKSLVLWVKDRVRANLPVSFPNGTTRDIFIQLLKDALTRDRQRREQKKTGESYLDQTFNNRLKSQSQWDKFNEELESTLEMIIGVRGVPLSYVIRRIEAQNFDATIPYEEAIIQAVSLDGNEFKQDARTVHKIILQNVHEDSDAYTYIKPLLRHRDGRRDMLALRERYSSDATRQGIINSAKATLDKLLYKNERSFPFEKFSAKLQKAYDELADNGRPVNNGDIVDALWNRIECAHLQIYIGSLKVDYQRNHRDYKLILQDIASEVATRRSVRFASGTGRNISAVYTNEGSCPTNGVHTADGSVFIGKYPFKKWNSDAVRPFRDEIVQARGTDNNGGNGIKSRQNKRLNDAVQRNASKLKKLKVQIASARAKLESATSSQANDGSDDDDKSDFANAGDAFGGKNSKKNKK